MRRLQLKPSNKQKLTVSQKLVYASAAFALTGIACVVAFLYSNLGTSSNSLAAGTCPGVPYFEVNLNGHSDSVYISPSISRSGQCCGASNPDRCIEFAITLDTYSEGINFEIASGPQPVGSMFYYIDCLNPVVVGQPICLSGGGNYKVIFCKPGNNQNTYRITSYSKVTFPKDTSVRIGGPAISLNTSGLNSSSVVWRSIYPGISGQYNSFLSNTNSTEVLFLPQNGSPSYIDYEISGIHTSACGSTGLKKDTVRITVYPAITVLINPNPAIIPANGSLTLTANVSGGMGTYTYQWFDANNQLVGSTSSITVSSPGNYQVVVCDALCASMGSVSSTISVTQATCILPVNIGISAITSSTAKVSWTAIPGVYGYKIRRREVGSSTWTNTGSYAPTPYRKLVELIENTAYEFQIQTVCNSSFADTSEWSPLYTFTTRPVCAHPENLIMLSVSDTHATIGWSAASNAVKYRVRYKTIGETTWINKYQTVTQPLQRKITGLFKNAGYEIQVLTDCGYADYSAFSNTIYFTTTTTNQRNEGDVFADQLGVLSIYPNPNSGNFKLNLLLKSDESCHLEVINIAGAKVWQEEIIPEAGILSKQIVLDQNLPKGIYFLKVKQNEEEYSARILLTQ